MNTRALTGAIATAALCLAPSAAVAEVMDKVSAPWEPGRLAPVAIVTGLCAAAAWRSGRSRTWLAVVLAGAWAAAGFGSDELQDSQLGPVIRAELSAFELEAYQVLDPVESLLPLAVVAALVARRRRRG